MTKDISNCPMFRTKPVDKVMLYSGIRLLIGVSTDSPKPGNFSFNIFSKATALKRLAIDAIANRVSFEFGICFFSLADPYPFV